MCFGVGGCNGPANPWGVKVLRLKYMTGLAMQWKEIHQLIPELIYGRESQFPKAAILSM